MSRGANLRRLFDWTFPSGPEVFNGWRSFAWQRDLKGRFLNFLLFLLSLIQSLVWNRGKKQCDCVLIMPIKNPQKITNLDMQPGLFSNFPFQCLDQRLTPFDLSAWKRPELRSRNLAYKQDRIVPFNQKPKDQVLATGLSENSNQI